MLCLLNPTVFWHYMIYINLICFVNVIIMFTWYTWPWPSEKMLLGPLICVCLLCSFDDWWNWLGNISLYVVTVYLFRYPIVLIAMYNVVDFIARYIPLVQSLKLESRKGLLIAILSRFLLIPAFYFTAKYGDQGWMILLTSFLGLTNGYLTVCVLTVAPRGYKASVHNPQFISTWILN